MAADAGFPGVGYWLRHEPAQKLYGVALFGPADADASPEEATAVDGDISDEVLDQARTQFGYRILPTP